MRSKDSTSYSVPELKLLASLAESQKPKLIVELGAQKGVSAQYLMGVLEDGGRIEVIDLFESTYRLPPHGETHSDIDSVIQRLARCAVYKEKVNGSTVDFEVHVGNAKDYANRFEDKSVDVLHIDICNCKENLLDVLPVWIPKIKRLGILEGGRSNSWQAKNGFAPYAALLQEYETTHSICTIPFDKDHGLTLVIPKEQ